MILGIASLGFMAYPLGETKAQEGPVTVWAARQMVNSR